MRLVAPTLSQVDQPFLAQPSRNRTSSSTGLMLRTNGVLAVEVRKTTGFLDLIRNDIEQKIN